MNKKYFFPLACLALLAIGCFKDDLSRLKNPVWNPDVAVPLVNTSLTIKDVLTEFDTANFIKEDSTHMLSLIYTGDIFSADANSLLTFSAVSFKRLS